MKQVISKSDVEKVMREMASQGRKITSNSLHAALNHRGSMTTLLKLKAEIESAAQPITDSAEGLKTFREVWALAVEEGRKQQEDATNRLKEDQQSLIAENERLDGKAAALENLAKELETAKSAEMAELVKVNGKLEEGLKQAQAAQIQATDQACEALAKLTAEQSAHAAAVSALRHELTREVKKSHDLELELVRAKAHLEARSAKPVKV